MNRGEMRNQKYAIIAMILICVPIVILYLTFFRLIQVHLPWEILNFFMHQWIKK